MTGKERVVRAIEFDNPDSVPICFWNRDHKRGDIMLFELAHTLGLHVWFHCCGNITSIVPDFHGIGVDVMNISQPNAVDIPKIGTALKGKQCFIVPISYQTVSISGTQEEIKAEAQWLYTELGTKNGGFIGYVEDYSCMGMSEDNFQACGDGFRELM